MHYVDGFTGGVIWVKVLILYLKNGLIRPTKICVILAFLFSCILCICFRKQHRVEVMICMLIQALMTAQQLLSGPWIGSEPLRGSHHSRQP